MHAILFNSLIVVQFHEGARALRRFCSAGFQHKKKSLGHSLDEDLVN